jgi:hypothetical protein
MPTPSAIYGKNCYGKYAGLEAPPPGVTIIATVDKRVFKLGEKVTGGVTLLVPRVRADRVSPRHDPCGWVRELLLCDNRR